MSEIAQLTDLIRKFRDERDWAQFHNAKGLATGLSIETAELLEQFLWKKPHEADSAKVRGKCPHLRAVTGPFAKTNTPASRSRSLFSCWSFISLD